MTTLASTPKQKQKPKAKTPDEGFAGIPATTLKALARKIVKLRAPHRMLEALRTVESEAAQPKAILRHLVVSNLIDPLANGYVIELLIREDLVGDEGDDAAACAIAEALARRDERGTAAAMIRSSSLSYFPDGWESEVDSLVFRAYRVAPAAFDDRAARYAPVTRRGLAFVTRRCGGEIDPALAVEIVTALAVSQATGYGITLNVECPFVDDAGDEHEHRLEDLTALRTLALRFVTAEIWDRALADATLRNKWGLLENVASAIEQLPLTEITRLFSARFSPFGDSSEADEHITAILDRRSDSHESLRAPITIPSEFGNTEAIEAAYRAAADRKR